MNSKMRIGELTDELIRGNFKTPEELEQLFTLLRQWFSVPKIILREGVFLYRARIINDISEIQTAHQLSYTPAEYNISYKRASTPSNTMFYSISGDSYWDCIFGCFSEICECFRKPNAKHKNYKIIVGLWETTTELTLPQIINIDGCNKSDAFQNASEYTNLLNSLGNIGIDIANFWRFMNKEFTKIVTTEEEYWISSIFTEWLIKELNSHGVIYESVQATDPKLRNVHCIALTPKVADTCLKFHQAHYFEFNYDERPIQLNPPIILDL